LIRQHCLNYGAPMRMWTSNHVMLAVGMITVSVCGTGCEDKQATPGQPAKTTPAAPTAAPPPRTAPTASAAPSEPKHDCPEGSTGDGTFNKPCEAKGTARMMEVKWTGKMTDTGPSFRVTNTSKIPIVYGKLAVYFYDKAGKQLEVKDATASPPKNQPMQWCSGKIFDGPMKAGEKAVITFSCVKKEHVPEGATAIEGELQMVGFADESGKKTEYYWKNPELTPDARPKSKK
jgi:hypothetical protein